MRSTFRLELDVVLDTDATAKLIAVGKDSFRNQAAVTAAADFRRGRTALAEEFIADIEDALMDLVEHNPLLTAVNVEVERISCRELEDSARCDGSDESDLHSSGKPVCAADDGEVEDQIDEFETGLYLCRWPNGDFSVVKADTRQDAVLELDEWAGAEPASLIPLETFMADFRLADDGEIELTEFGEETAEFIWDNSYPELNDILTKDGVSEHVPGQGESEMRDTVRRAVEHERKRLWDVQREGTPAKTAIGRELQKRLRTVGAVADRYVELAVGEILRKAGDRGKPN